MLRISIVILLGLLAASARADCECICIDGLYTAVCEDVADAKPQCPADPCAISPPVADEEVEESYLPPARRRACRREMAWDPVLMEYRRIVVCD